MYAWLVPDQQQETASDFDRFIDRERQCNMTDSLWGKQALLREEGHVISGKLLRLGALADTSVKLKGAVIPEPFTCPWVWQGYLLEPVTLHRSWNTILLSQVSSQNQFTMD